MRIDIHAHAFPSAYLDRLGALGHPVADAPRGLGASDSADDVARRLALMDATGVDRQVVSSSSLVPWVGEEGPASDAARFGNEAYAELVGRHPARLAAFAVLPLPHLDAALAEVERALALPGIVGIGVTTSVAGRSIADAAFEPLFEELDRRSAVLFIHPAGRDAESPLIREAGLSWLVGAPVEDTVAAVHLIARGVPARYPRLKIVVAHLGGALPMLVRRLEALFPRLVPDAPEPPSAAVRRLWFDTVAHGFAPALTAAGHAFGADRLVLGTDYPYVRAEHYAEAVAFVEAAGLPSEAVAGILGGTAASLLSPVSGS